jgi:hypothetical protein
MNRSASDLIARRNAKTIFADIVVQKKNVEEGRQLRLTYINNYSAGILPNYEIGSVDTTQAELNNYLQNNTTAPTPSPPALETGSMYFDGSDSSYLEFVNADAFALNVIGSGQFNFTIEWFQYMINENDFPRIFSVGTYGDVRFAVSIETGTIYLWGTQNNTLVQEYIELYNNFDSFNEWVHMALTREGTALRFYINGQKVYEDLNSTIYLNTYAGAVIPNMLTPFVIGNELVKTQISAFKGYITNFHYVRGNARYTGNSFIVPTEPLTPITGTRLLLLSSTSTNIVKDSSSGNRPVTNTGVSWNTLNPFT